MEEQDPEDSGLFERFQQLLESLGIRVEEVHQSGGVEQHAIGFERQLSLIEERTEERSGLQRSASAGPVAFSAFQRPNEAQNSGAEQKSLNPPISAPSLTRRNWSHPSLLNYSGLPSRGREKDQKDPKKLRAHHVRGSSVSSQGSIRISRRERQSEKALDAYSADESEQDALSEKDAHRRPFQPEAYHISDTQLDLDADDFGYSRDKKLRRKYLLLWRERLSQRRENQNGLVAVALEHDRGILLRQGFDQWKSKFGEARQSVETENFFAHLEKRAGKARDLFLLTKAFTHWAQSASDEASRTSVARRHILRTKYFKAWKDVTVVNELKVRRVGLSKFLTVWRSRVAVYTAARSQAVSFQETHLARHVYWRWFWAFCERRAPLWAAFRARRSFFAKWADITAQLKHRAAWVDHMHAHDLQRKLLTTWKTKAELVKAHGRQAIQAGAKSSKLAAIKILRKRLLLVNEGRLFAEGKNSGMRKKAFSIWNERSKNSISAQRRRSTNLLRNSFTAWNDKIRCKKLTTQNNERVVLQALYKWVLESRASLLKRVLETNQKKKFIELWHLKSRDERARIGTALSSVLEAQRLSLLRSTLDMWRAKSNARAEQNAEADALVRDRLLGQMTALWLTKYRQMQKFQYWSGQARFYIVTKKTLHLWKTAVTTARKARRRQAYAYIRKKNKIALVRSTLEKWRSAAAQITVNEARAKEMEENRLMSYMSNVFTTWHNRATLIIHRDQLAREHDRVATIKAALADWVAAYRHVLSINEKAANYRKGLTAIDATSCIKKINWRLFKVQSQGQTALALRQRNREKHVRNMIRYWLERTFAVRDQRNVEQFGSPSKDDNRAGGGDDTMAQAEQWTAYDQSVLGLANFHLDADVATSTPLPGYLRTPSKRNAIRAMVLEQSSQKGGITSRVFATPRASQDPGVSMSAPAAGPSKNALPFAVTPFERKLRAKGYAGDLGGGSRSGLPRRIVPSGKTYAGRAATVGFAGFEDILEDDSGTKEN